MMLSWTLCRAWLVSLLHLQPFPSLLCFPLWYITPGFPKCFLPHNYFLFLCTSPIHPPTFIVFPMLDCLCHFVSNIVGLLLFELCSWCSLYNCWCWLIGSFPPSLQLLCSSLLLFSSCPLASFVRRSSLQFLLTSCDIISSNPLVLSSSLVLGPCCWVFMKCMGWGRWVL